MIIDYSDFNQVIYNFLEKTNISVNYEVSNEDEKFPFITYSYSIDIEFNYKCIGIMAINVWDNSGNLTILDNYIEKIMSIFEEYINKPVLSQKACYRFFTGVPGDLETYENNLASKSIQIEYSIINL